MKGVQSHHCLKNHIGSLSYLVSKWHAILLARLDMKDIMALLHYQKAICTSYFDRPAN